MNCEVWLFAVLVPSSVCVTMLMAAPVSVTLSSCCGVKFSERFSER